VPKCTITDQIHVSSEQQWRVPHGDVGMLRYTVRLCFRYNCWCEFAVDRAYTTRRVLLAIHKATDGPTRNGHVSLDKYQRGQDLSPLYSLDCAANVMQPLLISKVVCGGCKQKQCIVQHDGSSIPGFRNRAMYGEKASDEPSKALLPLVASCLSFIQKLSRVVELAHCYVTMKRR